MPKYCCVYDCRSSGYETERSFFSFPSDLSMKKQWTERISRKQWTPSKYSVVCDLHFTETDFRKTSTDRPVLHQRKLLTKHAVPSKDLRGRFTTLMKERSTLNSSGLRTVDDDAVSSSHILMECNEAEDQDTGMVMLCEQDNFEFEVKRLRLQLRETQEVNRHLRQRIFSYENLNDSGLLMYTGIERSAFLSLISFLRQFLPYEYYTGKRVTSISYEDQLLCTLLKLKQNSTDEDIGFRFGVSRKTVNNIFMTFLNVMYITLFENLVAVKMPSLIANQKYLPDSFKEFPCCRIVIDCTEIKVDTPRSDLKALSETYSNYKSNYTSKFLVGVAPNGTIIFVSDAFPGTTSDKMIVRESQVLSHLKPGDLILADKGFTIHDILPSGVHLNLPPFLFGKPRHQFTEMEARYTRDLARARIHVERAIQRIKVFQILNTFPTHYRPYASKLFRVCCCLVNLQTPLINGIFDDV